MTRAISRDSFNESKQYVGVHLQQGRPILDADWNEGQDIMATLTRRAAEDAIGDGVVNDGFEILPATPGPWDNGGTYEFNYFRGGAPLLQRFPQSPPFDAFDTADLWTLSTTPGKLRTSRDLPYEGKTFLRLSDHTGTIQITKNLATAVDLSAFQFAFFRFRVNQNVDINANATFSFFIEDQAGNRNAWRLNAPLNAKDVWMPGLAIPLDLKFSIVDLDLLPAFTGKPYVSTIVAFGAPSSTVTWTVTGQPGNVSITPQANANYARLTGSPTAAGTFNLTVTATSSGVQVSRAFTLRVQDPPALPIVNDYTRIADDLPAIWDGFRTAATKPATGNPANLAQIKRYGFEVPQTGSPAMIWDFDALYLGSRAQVAAAAANNFVISGPSINQVDDAFKAAGIFPVRPPQPTPRAYVGGLAGAQPRDVLYRDQADPSDPPLTVPPAAAQGAGVRKDLVYLDLWREPVTYVEDPELREIALGGPDTSTRMWLRQRVRVAQGSGSTPGALPVGNGIGLGTLSTEGTYTDQTNRLYLVEIDTPGDIGTATLRWSEDNASTIQRVIATVPPSSLKVTVEDASAFQPGDLILLRKEFVAEEHHISSILGNTITLQEATGASTTFALTDRPKIQRWNGFHVPIVADSNDSTLSAAINLSRGVKVRFGGKAMLKGDFWTFRTRYLAGDDATAISSSARIETLDFQPAQGVYHRYTPLGLLIRDPNAHESDRIKFIRDLRKRGGQLAYHSGNNFNFSLSGTTPVVASNLISLGLTNEQSLFLCTWTGVISAPSGGASMRLEVEFYDNTMTVVTNHAAERVTLAATTIICDAASGTGAVRRSAVATNVGSAFGGSEIVAARAFFTLLSPGGATISMIGALSIIEVKNSLMNLSNFL